MMASMCAEHDDFLNELERVLDYNPNTGEIFWKVTSNTRTAKVGQRAGHLARDGRRYIRLGGKNYLAYRLAWLLTYGKWHDNVIDHIDGDKSNDKISNLRDVEQYVNQQNERCARSNSKTGLLGICWVASKGKFKAQIRIHPKRIHLGYFTTAEKAHEAYLKAKREIHEGCTI